MEAEEYFDCMEDDSNKGQVDLDLSDDSPSSPSSSSFPKGQSGDIFIHSFIHLLIQIWSCYVLNIMMDTHTHTHTHQ